MGTRASELAERSPRPRNVLSCLRLECARIQVRARNIEGAVPADGELLSTLGGGSGHRTPSRSEVVCRVSSTDRPCSRRGECESVPKIPRSGAEAAARQLRAANGIYA